MTYELTKEEIADVQSAKTFAEAAEGRTYTMSEGDQDVGTWKFFELPVRAQRAIREDPEAGSWELPIEEDPIDEEGRDAPPGAERISLFVEEA